MRWPNGQSQVYRCGILLIGGRSIKAMILDANFQFAELDDVLLNPAAYC